MIEELCDRASALLREASRQGAEEAQVVATHEVSCRVAYEKNDFNISAANTMSQLKLKIHRHRRLGSTTTNETDVKALQEVVARALTLADYSLEDEYLILPRPTQHGDLSGRLDPALEGLDAGRLHELGAAFIRAAREEPRLAIKRATTEVSVKHTAIVNSHELQVADRSTSLYWFLLGLAKTETEISSFDYDGGSTWRLDGAQAKTEESARMLARKLAATLGARKGESYKGAVLLAPSAVQSLLLFPLYFHISGQQIMDGKSRWEASLGKQVASSNLTLTDNPFNLEFAGATPFDAEGVAVRPTRLVNNGILETHVDSTYTGYRRGTVSTGHAGGLHAVEIAPGDKSLDELLHSGERMVVLHRFSGNTDPTTGDFSGVAKGSHYYKGGEHQHPLVETMIAGNFFELLMNIVALSRDVETVFSQYKAPWMLVDGISVTAG